jgi:hypothetical protein
MSDEEHFASPEEAVLADWPAAAHARVVSVDVRGRRAEVVIDTDPHYLYWVYCVRDVAGWREVVSGNGPTLRWEDPSDIHWT